MRHAPVLRSRQVNRVCLAAVALVVALGAPAAAASADSLTVTLGPAEVSGTPQDITLSGSVGAGNSYVTAFRQPSSSACAATYNDEATTKGTTGAKEFNGHSVANPGSFSFLLDPNDSGSAPPNGSYIICGYVLTSSTTATAQAGPYTVQSPPPAVVTGGTASTGDPTTIALTGTVNPNHSNATYQFDYGTTTAYGQSTPAPSIAGSTSSPQPVLSTISVSGFPPGTTLHYRLEATNAGGPSYGGDQVVATPGGTPQASAGPASNLTGDGFTLNATVLGNAAVNSVFFRYKYGGAPTDGDEIGAGTQSLPFAANNDGAEHTVSVPVPLGFDGGGARLPFPGNGVASAAPYQGSKFRNAQATVRVYYQLVLNTDRGTQDGPVQTVTSPRPARAPSVATGAARTLHGDGGLLYTKLTGTVDDHGQGFSFQAFQVGPTTAYGLFCPAVTEAQFDDRPTAGPANSGVPYQVAVTYCDRRAAPQPGAIVHYRLVAGNGVFTSYGRDQTFTIPGGSGPTPARAVAQSLGVSGHAASVAAILAHGGYSTTFTAPAAGREQISWYAPSGTAAAARAKHKAKPVLVAQGTGRASKAGKVKLKIKLTRQGRTLLKRVKRGHSLRLTANGTFIRAHGKRVTGSKKISLKR